MFSTANDNNDLTALNAELLKALAAGSTAQIDSLKQTRDTQLAVGSLLQNEAQRLQKKYGSGHVRVQQAKSRLQRNTKTIKDLEVELEIVDIRQPEVDEKSALLQGRVVDENNRGMARLVVYLSNGQGQLLPFLGTAETTRVGYYALPLSPQVLQKLAKAEPEGVFLSIRTLQGKSIYQRPAATQLKSGDRITLEVRLNRQTLTPIDGGQPTTPPTGGEPPMTDDDWMVSGQVRNAVTGEAIAGVRVNAIDNNRRFDDKLGEAITTENGTFSILYAFEATQADGAPRGHDLYVTVVNEKGTQLYSSQPELRQNASREEKFEVNIGGSNEPDTPTRPNMPLEGSVIWFETGSTTPRQDRQFAGERLLELAIQRIQTFLKTNRDSQIALRGYASVEDGERAEALSLSNKRAEVIRAQLLESGISANLLTVTAHGISTTYPDVSLNQRVEIVLPE